MVETDDAGLLTIIFQDARRAITGAIVNDDQIEITMGLPQYRLDALLEKAFPIESCDGNADPRRRRETGFLRAQEKEMRAIISRLQYIKGCRDTFPQIGLCNVVQVYGVWIIDALMQQKQA